MLSLLLSLVLFTPTAYAQGDPAKIELSPLAKRHLKDELLSDKQRRAAMIFHGQWDELEDQDPLEQLHLIVARYEAGPDLKQADNPLVKAIAGLGEPTAESLELSAKALLQAGSPEAAIQLLEGVDAKTRRLTTGLLLAQAYEQTGQYKRTLAVLGEIRVSAQAIEEAGHTAEGRAAFAQATLMRARLEGRPADEFHFANQLLSKAHEELDPLYWPTYIAEAELLWSKGNPTQAFEAIATALTLNPKSSEAWYLLGSMQARYFDFKKAEQAIKQLRSINKTHPLADALEVQSALRQKDMGTATETIAAALKRYPTHRKLLALNAAVKALTYDKDAKAKAIAAFDKLAPGNPLAQFEVGQAYSDARQYALAEPHLKQAIARMPGWSEPQLALGELYMQWGKLQDAAAQLRAAATLDPFHKAINNQKLLATEMLGYGTIKTDQFVVRYLPGIDEVLARDVALHMGEMVETFIKRFDHDPPALTQVDLMPDDQHFAVRVTGLPEIWTIAACTGDVIAMTPPRPGPKRAYGEYNWLNVMGHEYAHVVNLSQTNNRVPHWFTEGCAVQMETTGRLWSQYQLLSKMYNTGGLFAYDEINWGFIRPTQPHHRSLAYAQSAWIMEYIETQHGWDKALAMLESYKAGVGEHETITKVFGFSHDELMKKFKAWAGEQVKAWGMTTFGKKPADQQVAEMLAAEDASSIDTVLLDTLIAKHPDEPGLLKLSARLAIASADSPAAIKAIKAYQKARPVDPWADRELARLALASGDSATAIQSLIALDRIEGDTPEYAVELAKVYRGRKDFAKAIGYAERALLREPYNATFREQAAAIAVQQGDLKRAAFHVESLALLEPKRSIHPRRLAVIYKRLGEPGKSAEALARGKKLKAIEDGE